jgi:hypothetical protein
MTLLREYRFMGVAWVLSVLSKSELSLYKHKRKMKRAFRYSELTDLKILATFEVITMVSTKVNVVWYVTIWSLIEIYRYYGRRCCVRLQCKRLRRYVASKYRYNSTRLQGVASRKTLILIFSFLCNRKYISGLKISPLQRVLNFMQENERKMQGKENNFCCN